MTDEPSRYEMIHRDSRIGLSKGDIVVCSTSESAEHLAVVRRERDDYQPGVDEPRTSLRHISGPEL